ncbi:hypothetical protein TEA_009869 [Camellia sinensis var. sinensis]|uniref:Protein ENHANCED DISEASE RESISTANCE 2 C-terminal domain-containing protein n=1 Tax=Camellia sinensis var. sinensis TaxID=542762 RepID=A0A4S4EIH4_CAMSN|nr:hypothetical protein TEA_009869 [Camellia sinensis var. sinensis]
MVPGGGFNISPLKPQNGRPRTQVQHLVQIDLKGWGVGYISSFQQHCLLQMLNNVAGLCEYFSQTDERNAHPRIPIMVNMASTPMSSKKSQKLHNCTLEEECIDQIDLSCFLGNLQRDDRDNGRDCWRISDGNNFRVRGNNFYHDKSKVASEKGFFSIVINLQVLGSTHYSMIFYFVMKELVPGSLLQRFVDGDDEFRNSRLKIIPSVPKANTANEFPKRLIGVVRVSHVELSFAIVPKLDQDPSD